MSMKSKNTESAKLLLLSGGSRGERSEEKLLSEFIKSLNINDPAIAYIGAASDNDTHYFSMMKSMLLNAGAGKVFLAEFKSNGKNNLEDADIIFVSGGDVKHGMKMLKKFNAENTIIKLFNSGIPFIGVSAGSIMICKAWIEWTDPEDDSSAKLFSCLGLADFICDTHDESDGWSELKAAVSISPEGTPGYGIPSGGGLLINSGGNIKVCGCRATVFKSCKGTAGNITATKS